MALRAIVLRSRLDAKKKELEALRAKDGEFEKREAEIEAAVGEMTEDTPEEDRLAVEKQAENLDRETEEHETAKTSLEDEIRQIEKDIEDEEKKQRSAAAAGRPAERGMEVPAAVNSRTKFFGMGIQERDAFFAREDVKHFVTEVRACIKEKRSISNVGLVIPQVMLELLKTKVEETSKLIGRVNRRPVTGTARQRIMGVIPEGVWTEMCAKLNELDLGFNDIEVDGYKVGGFFAVCNAIIEDNDVNLVSEIINALGKAIGKALDKAVIYGTGAKMPMGIVTRLAQKAKPADYPATAPEWKDLSAANILAGTGATGINLFKELVTRTGLIENDYSDGGLAWVMNRKTHTKLMVQSMDKNLNAAIVAGVGKEMPVIGGEIVELPFVPDDNIVFGYFDMYLLAERAGTELARSEHYRFLDDQTVFKGTARYDGMPVIPEAFCAVTISAEAPETSAVFTEDKANA